jgi:diketogulonate reductase-like aldo/keto reductase
MTPIPTRQLNDGSTIPAIGLGTYSLNGSEGADAIASGLGLGYRLLDTAFGYGNEDAVGEGIRRSGVDRDEIVVTSKVPDEHHGADLTRDSFERSLDSLGLETLDIYLIHWPRPENGLYVATWEAMVELQASGRVRTIGVCNFDEEQLDRVADATGVTPALNQVPVNPLRQQVALRKSNADRGVLTESYTPLGRPAEVQADPVLAEIATAHGATINQVALRWNVQLGAVPIPMSRSTEHQRQNLEIFEFELSDDEMARIAGIPAPVA